MNSPTTIDQRASAATSRLVTGCLKPGTGPTGRAPLFPAVLAALIILLIPLVSHAAWYDSNWAYRKAVTIDGSQVSGGPHDNFPVLISITDADLSAARPDGYDLLFTLDDGTTKLSHEIEKFDNVTGELAAWVKIPSPGLTNGADLTLYLYYGNAVVSNQQNVLDVWSKNYLLVYHLHDDFNDSRGTSNATNNGSVDVSPAQIADGQYTDGSTYINTNWGDGVGEDLTELTYSCWIKADALPDGAGDEGIVHKTQNGMMTWGHIDSYYEGAFSANILGDGYLAASFNITALDVGRWVYLVGSYQVGSLRAYKDGNLETENTLGTVDPETNDDPIRIGKHSQDWRNNPEDYFPGEIDEVRISNVVRPADWILTEYRNQNSPGVGGFLLNVGAEENEAGDGLLGNYYDQNNTPDAYFIGGTIQRVDAIVDFNWGTGSPDPGISNVDNFSVRWTGQVETIGAGDYTFYTTTDDGVRLWIDGSLVIDQWQDQGPTEYNSGPVALAANQRYDIVMEYYEAGGGAVAQLSWSGPFIAQEIIPQSQLFSSDLMPPAAVTDLATTGTVTDNSVQLTWIAPGDDGSSGTAAAYDIRYSTSPITDDTDFNNADQATGEPAPQAAGSSESFTVTGLSSGTIYYFAIKTADEVPNWSALSNAPSGNTNALGTCGTNLLMVVATPGSPSASDNAKKAIFESMGYAVTLLDDDDADYSDDIAGQNAMFISESVSSGSVNTKAKNLDIGIVVEEIALDDDMGFVTTRNTTSGTGTAISIVDNSHYITSTKFLGSLAVYTIGDTIYENVNVAGAGLRVLANGPLNGDPALFIYEDGAELADLSFAANRRVGFQFIHTSNPNNWAAELTDLLQRSLEWASCGGVTHSVNGSVSEDTNGDGSLADAIAIPSVSLDLFQDGGDGQPDGGDDSSIATTTTDGSGTFSFSGVSDGIYWVVADSTTLSADGNLWAEQTYASAGGWCADGSGGTAERAIDGTCFGGRRANASDDPSLLANAEHVIKVTVAGGDVTDVDFGFSYNVVTNTLAGDNRDDDGVANRTVQGSLRQFIQNANAIAGANVMRFVPAEATNASGSGQNWWQIAVTTSLPSITAADTTIDGTAYHFSDGTTLRNTNTITLGYFGPVGLGPDGKFGTADEPTLSGLAGPELEIINERSINIVVIGLDLQADNLTVKDLAIYGFGDTTLDQDADIRVGVYPGGTNFTGIMIDGCVVGSSAADFADPGAGARTAMSAIAIYGADGGTVQNCLIGFAGDFGIRFYGDADNWTVQGNELRSCALVGTIHDAIDIEADSSGTIILNNLITQNQGSGVDSWSGGGGYTIENNTILQNGQAGTEPSGIRLFGSGSSLQFNRIEDNAGSGILVVGSETTPVTGQPAIQNRISQNSFSANDGIAIDLGGYATDLNLGDGITLNDGGTDVQAGNIELDFPMIASAVKNAGTTTVTGTACNNCEVEVYRAVADGDGSDTSGSNDYGEGVEYLGSTTADSSGNWSVAITGLSAGDDVSAIAIDAADNSSEFGQNTTVTVGAGWYDPAWPYRKAVNLDGNQFCETVNGFPVPIIINDDTDLRDYAQADGDDILFTLADGTTQVPHEIEAYNNADADLVAWVKLDIEALTDQTIYVYYGNAGATNQQNAAGIWDTRYVGVWHLSQDPAVAGANGILDSTSNNNHGTDNGSMDAADLVPGPIGTALDFDGSNDYISVASNATLQMTTSLTLEGWLWVRSGGFKPANDVFPVIRKGEVNPNNYQLGARNWTPASSGPDTGHVFLSLDQTDDTGLTATNVVNAGTWYHLAATWDGTTRRIYVDGAEVLSGGYTGPIGTDSRDVYFGGRLSEDFGDGRLDELRISNQVMTPEWIAAEVCTAGGVVGSTGPAEGPAVTSALAEISPNSVTTGSTGNSFAYDILPTIGTGDTGVDRLVITAPAGYANFSVSAVSVGGVAQTAGSGCPAVGVGEYCLVVAGQDITVTLGTKVTADATHIQVQFSADAPASAGSADFTSTVDDSATAAAAQATTMGDADGDSGDADSWTVNTVNGLSAHWPLDEGAGTIADEIVNNHDGTYNGAIAHSQSAACATTGTAVGFNGTDAYIEVPHSADFMLDAGTVSFWAFANNTGNAQVFFSKDWTGLGNGGHLTVHVQSDGYIRARLQSTSGDNIIYSANPITWSSWFHVAFSWGPSGMALYIDGGAPDATDPYTGGLGTTSGGSGNTEPIYFGASAWGGLPLQSYLNGYMDDIRIYDRQLGQSEIDTLAACGGSYSISGTVFEDINYGGGSGRSYATADAAAQASGWAAGNIGVGNATVELYDNAGDYISSTTTAADGSYGFSSLAPALYTVRVVNSTVKSNRTSTNNSEIAVQVYRADGNGEPVGTGASKVGGEQPADVDAPGNGGAETLGALQGVAGQYTQSLATVDASGSDVSNVDFGFNFDTIVNTNGSGQGSLNQFILNSNVLSDETLLDQDGLTVGKETSIFMIPDDADPLGRLADSGFSGSPPDGGSGSAFVILQASDLPDITGSDTILDGGTQTSLTGDDNPAVAGVTTGPEVIIDYGGVLNVNMIDIEADGVILRRIGLVRNASLECIEIQGLLSITDPIRIQQVTIVDVGGSGIFIDNIASGGPAQILEVSGSVIRDNSSAGAARDGIEMQSATGVLIDNNQILQFRGYGIDLVSEVSDVTITGNQIESNGAGGTEASGIGLRTNVSNVLIQGNTITANNQAGIILYSTAQDITISQNTIYSNGALGIDLGAGTNLNGDGVTANDPGDGDGGGNDLLNFPVLNQADFDGSDTTIDGSLNSTANTTFTLEFFASAAADPSGYGEGETYLGSDTVVTDGTGNVTFSIPLVGVSVSSGDTITATATDPAGNTSEFSAGVVATVSSGACGANLVMVTADGAFASGDDNDKRLLFESWGFTVTAIDDDAIQTDFDNAAASNDLMFISYSVSASALGSKARALSIPIVSEDTSTWQRLMYSSSNSTASDGSTTAVNIIDNSHEITSSFSTGSLTIFSPSTSAGFWATTLPSGAQVLAEQVGNSSRKWLITLESGAELGGTSNYAANRRVLIGTGGSNFNNWNNDLETIMQRSLNWASCGVAYTPAVTSAVAEISPNSVNIGTPANSFTYDILPSISGSATGVDQVVITAPAGFGNFSVTAVSVGGTAQSAGAGCPTVNPGEYCTTVVGQDITVTLGTPVTVDATNIQVQFTADAPLAAGSGDFTSTVDDTATATAAQSTVEGDANADGGGDGNDWSVNVSGCSTYGLPFFDDFNRADSSTVGNCWIEDDNGGSENAQIYGNTLFLQSQDGDALPRAMHTFTPQNTGYLRWTFDFNWTHDSLGGEGNYELWMQLGDSIQMQNITGGGDPQGVGVNIVWGRNSGSIPNHETLAYHSGVSDTVLGTLSGSHVIEVIVNLDTNRYDIIVDGSTWANGVPFDNSVDIDAVRFYTNGLNSDISRFDPRALDNVLIETIDCTTGRVSDGLQVLYDFQEGSGSTVNDVSGVGAPLNLTIGNTANTTWIPGGGLSVDAATIISSGVAATKIITAATATNEITMEAWVTPANTTQSGPARILTLSQDTLNRNFTLGQQGDEYVGRVRTTDTGNNAVSPELITTTSPVTTTLSHVVYTRDASGTARIYVNGSLVASRADVSGDFSTWNTGYQFALANELTNDRSWLGDYYLAAVYSKALTHYEVCRNYTAGLPTPPPTYSISGTVFEDVNYGGGTGRDYATAAAAAPAFTVERDGVTVELYDNAGNFVASTTTAGGGQYSFSGLTPALYTVRVVNGDVTSSRAGSDGSEVAVQTYRIDGDGEAAGTGASKVGGEQPADVDAPAKGGSDALAVLQGPAGQYTQSIATVDVALGDVTGVDFGFNFDTIVNTNDSGQGSLRQFILNSNLLDNTGLDQEDNPAGTSFAVAKNVGEEHSIFMIPATELVATIDGGSGTVMLIQPTTSALPDIQDAYTVINGLTQSAYTGHTNGSSRVDEVTTGPEVIIDYQGYFSTEGPEDIFSILADHVTIDSLGLTGTTGDQNHPVDIEAGVSDTIVRNTTIFSTGASSLKFQDSAFNNQILDNVMRQCGTDATDSTADGIAFGGNNNGNTISGNHIIDAAGFGIDIVPANPNDSNTITGNLIKGSGASTSTQDAGIALRSGSGNTISGNTITGNAGEGVLIIAGNTANTITQNLVYNNGALGIDLRADSASTVVGDGVTANDGGAGDDGDTGANGLQNFPDLTKAVSDGVDTSIVGSIDTVPGTVYTIEFFSSPAADADPSGYGEGRVYLGSDTVTTDANGFFSFTSVLSGVAVAVGDVISATATDPAGNTSEFSNAVTVESGPPWYPGGWLYRDGLVLSGGDFCATVTGFPVPVVVSGNAGLQSFAQADGDDILFTLDDGVTRVSHEIESFTQASGDLVAWVKLDIQSGMDQTIYIYYGNATAANQQDLPGLWSADYKGVWHLHDDFDDSSTNGFTGTNVGSANSAGQIADGQDFNGSTDHIELGSATNIIDPRSPFTITAWLNLDTAPGTDNHYGVYTRYNTGVGDTNAFGLFVGEWTASDRRLLLTHHDGTQWHDVFSNSEVPVGQWAHVAAVYDGLDLNLYINGVSDGALGYTLPNNVAGIPQYIGTSRGDHPDFHFDGQIDEVRVSQSARSLAWLQAETCTAGGVLAIPDTSAPAAVTDLAVSAVTTATVTLTWTAPGDDGTTGMATAYDIRFAASPISDESAWSSAVTVSGEPAPQNAGSSETFTVAGLNPDTTYYFAIRTVDEVPNESGLSNSPSGVTANWCGNNLVMVTADGSFANGDDDAKRALFASRGYTVTAMDDDADQATFEAAAAANDLMFLSGTVDPGSTVGTKARGLEISIVSEHTGTWQELMYAGVMSTSSQSLTDIDIGDNSQYITSPFGNGSLTVFSAGSTIYHTTTSPPSGVQVLASTNSSFRRWMMVVESGGTLGYTGNEEVAANRRVFIGTQTSSFANWNDNLKTLVTRSLDWGSCGTSTPRAISGTVFIDINYGGGVGRTFTTANASAVASGWSAGDIGVAAATVELYENQAGNFIKIADTVTGPDGTYSFSGLSDGSYRVRVVNTSVSPLRGSNGTGNTPLSVQTFRNDPDSGGAVTGEVGGADPAAQDAGAQSDGTDISTITAQTVTEVFIAGAGYTGVDFGFNFDTIVNTNDGGQGSLRQFLVNANELNNDVRLAQEGHTVGIDTSVFMIPIAEAGVNGEFTVQPASALPTISDPVALDGTTQSGYGGTPIIELDGTSAGGGGVNGLNLTADNSTLRGLVINRFNQHGIFLSAGAGGNTIAGNYIGTDVLGAADLGNLGMGIELNGAGSNNTIGGTAEADRNVVSGNDWNGISLIDGSDGNYVQGNYIGLNAAGTAAVANTMSGVGINNAGSITIGGTAAGAGNVIAGNTQQGIWMDNTSSTAVTGNRIGTNAAGTAAVANGVAGIVLDTGATGIQIGGAAVGAGNLVSGNTQAGILLNGAVGNTIQGNRVGTDAAGTAAVANGTAGISLAAGSSGNTIGGTAAGEANTIAFNGSDGIVLTDAASLGNRISGNAIFSNTGLGIDLSDDGVTANDGGAGDDTDNGPNGLQNFPVLSEASVVNGSTTVRGSLDSAPATAYTVEFFSSATPDVSGNGEGQVYLGSSAVTTAGDGLVSFTVNLGAVTAGYFLTATAIEDSSGNTSEFSATVTAAAPAVKMYKRAFEPGGAPINNGSDLPRGTVVKFLIYINNRYDTLNDISIEDVLPAQYAYQSGTLKIDNTVAACMAGDGTCTPAEEGGIFAAIDDNTPLNDAVDTNDGAGYDGGSTTISAGSGGGNAQVDITADSVWALMFTAMLQ